MQGGQPFVCVIQFIDIFDSFLTGKNQRGQRISLKKKSQVFLNKIYIFEQFSPLKNFNIFESNC